MNTTSKLEERLNHILDRVVSEEFLRGRGLGNEIAFYVFDYPAECELVVRDFLVKLKSDIARRRPELRVCHIDLFALVYAHLQERKLLEPSLAMQQQKGDEALLKALASPLQGEKMAREFIKKAQPQEHDLILVSGVGSIYPMLRSHSLLNSLHALMGETPLLMFFPGAYNGQSLSLFNRLPAENYYRAFRLIS